MTVGTFEELQQLIREIQQEYEAAAERHSEKLETLRTGLARVQKVLDDDPPS